MWETRNGALHGKESMEAHAAEHAALNKRIEDQYTKGSAGLPTHAAALMKDSKEK